MIKRGRKIGGKTHCVVVTTTIVAQRKNFATAHIQFVLFERLDEARHCGAVVLHNFVKDISG